MPNTSDIIVRYPPSPTGLLHLGTARTVLYNYLFAKKNGGKIIMRLEDTDKTRSTKEFEENILDGIQKLGMPWDGEIVYQSTRGDIYKKYLQELLDKKKAYHCFCTSEELTEMREQANKEKRAFRYPGTWRNADEKTVQEKIDAGVKSVIRFKIPENTGDIVFTDEVRGEVKINAKELDDFVIGKNLDTPLYNFCVVIDDFEMNISHVIRGEDHISNTPKQILVYEAFGWDIPKFAHIPLILNSDKSKLSKRKNKVSVDDYLEEGFLEESLINFLALLGWNTGDEREFFTMDELISEFSLDRVHKSGAVFDKQKLEFINGKYIRELSLSDFASRVESFWMANHSGCPDDWAPESWNRELMVNETYFLKTLELIQERTKKLSEVEEYINLFYIDDATLEYDVNIFTHKKMKTSPETAKDALELSLTIINDFSGDWDLESLKNLFIEKIKEAGFKNGYILYPLRVALAGEEFSPGTLELLEIFGKERSILRINRGLELLGK